MRTVSMLGLLAIGVTLGTFAWADHHEGDHNHGFFDAAACDICKPWAENPQLMMGTKWETHTTKSGMLMVATAPAGQMEKFSEVCKKMDATVAKISSGEEPKGLCGFCEAMGGLMQSGAKMEKVETAFGNITLVTSDNPQTVSKIHAVAKQAQAEAEKMEAMMKKAG